MAQDRNVEEILAPKPRPLPEAGPGGHGTRRTVRSLFVAHPCAGSSTHVLVHPSSVKRRHSASTPRRNSVCRLVSSFNLLGVPDWVWCATVERERKRKEEKERKKKLVRRTWTVTVAAPLTAPLTHSGSQLEEAALASKQASTAAAGAAVDDDRYAKYTRMIKVGVPLDKVKEAMTVAGLNFSDLGIDHLLDGSVKPTPTPQAAAGADDAGSAP